MAGAGLTASKSVRLVLGRSMGFRHELLGLMIFDNGFSSQLRDSINSLEDMVLL